MKSHRFNPRRTGFTLIELLVVVAIIIVLIGILVPTLSAAKKRAKITEATSMLTGISTAVENYFGVFDTYPGPVAAGDTTGGYVTGTQNLLLGLGYAMYPTLNTPLAGQPIPAAAQLPVALSSSTFYVDAANPIVVRDFSSKAPNGNYKTYNAFYSFSKGLSPANKGANAWTAGGVTGAATGWAGPTIVDTFTDPLPILYYRHNANVEGTGDITNGYVSKQPSVSAAATNAIAATGVAPVSPVPAYYYDENAAYTGNSITSTSPTLTSPSGVSYTQGKFNENIFATDVGNVLGSVATSHGGYALISASADRIYGPYLNKNDDIVIVGGH